MLGVAISVAFVLGTAAIAGYHALFRPARLNHATRYLVTDRRVLIQRGSQELHLLVEADAVDLNPRSRRHPCLEVDDVTALRATLDANGVDTEAEDFPLPGRRRFFARDPFGNLIEFVTFEGGA